MLYRLECRIGAGDWIPQYYPRGATETQTRGAVPYLLAACDAVRLAESRDDGKTWLVLTTWRKTITERHHTATTTRHK